MVVVDANVAIADPTAPNFGIRNRLNKILARMPSVYAGARFFCLLWAKTALDNKTKGKEISNINIITRIMGIAPE